MRILNFGSCNLDIVYNLKHIVRPSETIAAESLSFHPGGKGLNQSIALSRAGSPVFHAGCIGTDGDLLCQALCEAGVDLRYLKTLAGSSGHAVIQVDENGENCIIIYPGTNRMITTEDIDRVLSDFSAGDLLLLQNEISFLPYLVQKASDLGMQIALNPSPYHDDLKKLDLSCIRYLILNEVEAEGFFKTRTASVISGILRSSFPELNVVLTLGKEGAVFITGTKVHHQCIYQVPIVDTTAAGDTFTGYFLSEISNGHTPEVAMNTAAAAAAIAVSRPGAASSIPSREEVERQFPMLTTLY